MLPLSKRKNEASKDLLVVRPASRSTENRQKGNRRVLATPNPKKGAEKVFVLCDSFVATGGL
jgi:hypothetical protein